MLSSLLKDWDAFYLFHRKPLRRRQSTGSNAGSVWKAIAPAKEASQLSSIEGLPAEILFMILDELKLETLDLVALGLCSKRLWAFMLVYVLSSSCGSWAGTEIVCTGNYLQNLPEPLVRANLAEIPKGTKWRGDSSSRHWNYSASLFHQQRSCHLECPWLETLHHLHLGAGVKDPDTLKTLEMSLKNLFSRASYPMGTGWVLRNLTTKEYVRLRIQSDNARAYVETSSECGYPIPVEQVLLTRLFWTRAPHGKSVLPLPPS